MSRLSAFCLCSRACYICRAKHVVAKLLAELIESSKTFPTRRFNVDVSIHWPQVVFACNAQRVACLYRRQSQPSSLPSTRLPACSSKCRPFPSPLSYIRGCGQVSFALTRVVLRRLLLCPLSPRIPVLPGLVWVGDKTLYSNSARETIQRPM